MNPTSTCVIVAPEKAEEEKGLYITLQPNKCDKARCHCAVIHILRTSTAQGQVLP